MSTEANQTVGADYNPFDQGNFATGGGLWDGKEVTVTRAVAGVKLLTTKDGKPVIDDKTKKQSAVIGLIVSGLAEGDEKERTVEYTCGEKMQPDADGESFSMKDGSVPKFHVNSSLGKLVAALTASGFPVRDLLVGVGAKYIGQQKWSKLVGAKLTFKAEAKLGKDGKPLKDAKGYEKNSFYPVKFVGMTAGIVSSGGGGSVGGVARPGSEAIVAKAEGLVIEALAAGPLTRQQLVQALAQKLAGDSDSNAVIGLIVRDDFHKGKAWKYEDGTASL